MSLALRSAISALVSFALLFLTSWRLACLATAVVPFLIGATFLAMRVVKRLAKESQAREAGWVKPVLTLTRANVL